MSQQDLFEDIRPYRDNEVREILIHLTNDPEFHDTLAKWVAAKVHSTAPGLSRWAVKQFLRFYFRGVTTVDQFQSKLEKPLGKVINSSSAGLSVSGLDQLDPNKPYLFVSNHRDIVMDPAMVNWTLYQNGFQTVRIAIGDNLLSKPFASHLMRLNKSFIVKRSVKGMREKLKAAKQLSQYIHHCVVEENANVWIAQREGRAKDGYDSTNPAVIGMFSLSKPKDREYASYINELNIVPVTISYERNPCDVQQAKEMYTKASQGSYKKRANEDLRSIARGITGDKGRIHVAFGEVLQGDFENDADVAKAIDQQIHANYHLFETNEWAAKTVAGEVLDASENMTKALAEAVSILNDDIKPFLLKQYANAVQMKQQQPPL
ncbi:1-acyl-sn-glycerol-3-phosphate acyltransferase [Salinibius halmophilus]|uniref:1-acyl-sn-glycerol-3-phosphate acyltransferase n=1 Tax=Salinibius halmophilus TaxID=1853216 RepID=UPI000E673044|nr:1-acyl-sn-glycerol-3-phosphate acyltransferase [Salinibius halmophilus]